MTRRRFIAAAIFLGALALRLAYVQALPGDKYLHAPHSDHENYRHWAALLAANRPVPPDISIQQPAYAWRFAAVGNPGDGPATMRRWHLAAGAAAPALLYLLAAPALGGRWSAFAALLYAACPVIVFTDATWSKEQLAVTGWLLVLLLLRSPHAGLRLLALPLALFALGLRELFIVPVLFAALAWYAPQRAWLRLAVLTLLLALAVWGWGVAHTAARAGQPPQGFAEPLYVGVWPGTNILYSPPPFVRPGRIYEAVDWEAETARRLGHHPSPTEENAYWLGQARAAFTAQPLAALRTMLLRVVTALWAGPLEDNYPYLVHYHASGVLPLLPPVWLLLALGLGGLLLWWRSGEQRAACRIVTGFLLGALLAPAPFYLLERLRLPLFPALAVAAAMGLAVAPRLPRRWLLVYAAGVTVAVSPALTACLSPAILAGTRMGWRLFRQFG
ncbi:MAG TPA: hypothetical protein PKM88_04380 [bacterium]|nr:hypothetical protein [bacterium]